MEALIMSKFWESIYCTDFSSVYNPFFLKNMSDALERTVKAINAREKIVIYGACNVDSICGVSSLLLLLKYLNADVEYYIPDTKTEVCNMDTEVIENHIRFLGAGLVITVGCGIESEMQLEFCKSIGMEVIVINNKKEHINVNTIMINPNQEGCLYKFKNLSAAGLIYKLTQAISMYYNLKCKNKYIDLTMLGTLSVGVPIIDENESIVNCGLKHLIKTNNHGIKALLKVQNIKEITIQSINCMVFIITPTINAIGKMDNARIVVELFTTNDSYRAEQIVKYLNKEVENYISLDMPVG
jgi:single-stranded DNA-specific DHH superfamily exonuclease